MLDLHHPPQDFSLIESLFFNEVTVLGLSTKPNNVTLNSEEIQFFTFDEEVNSLNVADLQISLTSIQNVISWT